MQIIFRFHKGQKIKRILIIFLFIKEQLPIFYFISYIFTKIFAKEAITISKPNNIALFFIIKINKPSIKV